MAGPALFTMTFAMFISTQRQWELPGAPFLLASLMLVLALVLAWHLGETIPRKLRSKGLRSKFIMPLPDPVILDW